MTTSALLSVSDALPAMSAAVRSGDMATACAIGLRAEVPLSLSAAELNMEAEPISRGAESTVYAGTYNGQRVAIKKLRLSTSSDLDRFRNELVLLSRLKHDNVVALVGARVLPPDYLLVLPLELHNLAHALYERAWRPDWPQVLRVGVEVAGALAQLHALGMVHR